MEIPDINPSILLIAGLALAVFVLLRKSRALLGRPEQKDSQRDSNAAEVKSLLGQRGRDSALSDAPNEVLRWQVEMHQTARDLKAEIDSKYVALQALMRQAEEQRQRLEQSVERARRAGLAGSRDVLETIENLASDPAAAADLPPLAGAPRWPIDREHTFAIRELAGARHSADQIAQRMGLSVGDVELALSLAQGTVEGAPRSGVLH